MGNHGRTRGGASRGLLQVLLQLAVATLLLISQLMPVDAAAGIDNACAGSSLAAVANAISFSTSNLNCVDKSWPSTDSRFLLWSLHDSVTNVVSIVVSMPLVASGRWVALGFSKEGYMITSTAIVGRLINSGIPTATEFYLKDKNPSQVFPDRTGLNFVTVPESHYDAKNKTIYIAFQVNFAKSAASPNYLLYAYGPLQLDGSLQIHDSHYSFPSTFVSGVSGSSPADLSARLAKAHGAVQVMGWGLLLPIGALIARYCRAWDPAWFYVHVAFQSIGFIFVMAGIGTGVVLSHRVRPSGFYTHRGLGIIIFFLACLQIFALVLRPKKDAKLRKYWNLYHGWVGRIALILAVANIFVGMHIATAKHSLRVGYPVILTMELLAIVVLESILWLRWRKQTTWNSFAVEAKPDAFSYGGAV